MRILFLATGFWFALSLSAQDLLYMQRGNPGSLLVNPAADVDARVWLSLPSINTTAQTSFAAGDVLGGDLGTLWRQFPSEAAGAIATHDMGLFSMGFKAKKSTFWLGSSLNFEGNALIDRDLVGFLLWGMKDANGDIDLNYDGRFEQTSAVVSARSNLHLGWQREFGSKLRVGATLNATQILGHAVMGFDSLGLRSVDRGNGFNELELYTQGYAAAYTNKALNVNLFDGTFLFDGSKLAKNSLISLDLGGTYQLTKNWMLAASYQGLGFEGRAVLDADTAVRFCPSRALATTRPPTPPSTLADTLTRYLFKFSSLVKPRPEVLPVLDRSNAATSQAPGAAPKRPTSSACTTSTALAPRSTTRPWPPNTTGFLDAAGSSARATPSRCARAWPCAQA